MGSNYISKEATINPSIGCIHDSTVGFSADFSVNGNVDGWEYYDGIHTYGAWAGFLFGTLYGEYGTVGRFNVFRAVDATTHYFIRLVMKYTPWPRDERGNHPLPTQGKIRWRTLQSTNWSEDKEIYFDLEADNQWHTYVINVGVAQWWQGDVNDLRIWPAVADADDGDEFFIRAVDIFSTESHECRNTQCQKFDHYSYPCPWIGLRSTCESAPHDDDEVFNIDNLAEFIININSYGNEIVKVRELVNGTGREAANRLAAAISRTNIGGYSEVQVDYTDDNTFKIYSGTIHEDSSVIVVDNELTRYLGFFNVDSDDTSTKTPGETPVDGYSPISSFKIKTHQALGLLDNNERTSITFDPFQYSVEGGRQDWLSSSTGLVSTAIGANDGDASMQPVRTYFAIINSGRTIIDHNHPFNASGRIKKISIQCTLDNPTYIKGSWEGARKSDELSAAFFMIMRPKRNGNMEVIYEYELDSRDPNRGYYDALYSLTQEGVELDVDVFVNKGDFMAVYNANMYAGKSVSGYEYDCQYNQISFKPGLGEVFDPGRLYGDGSAGLLIYAHGEDTQRRLYLDVDLGNRYNIEKIDVKGKALNNILEYNIASCLDINWQCELFDEYHWTRHLKITNPGEFWYQRYNVYYGLNRLNDNIYNVPDGLACDGYSLTTDNSGSQWNLNAGPGVVPTNPYYFWINGDEEWLGVWLHSQWFQYQQAALEFDFDPVAIYLHFPHEKMKKIYKSKIYFKEKFNFRSFALSTYGGFYYTLGNADDHHYDLIPEYSKIALDNIEYYEGSPTYSMVEDYLFKNPCTGHMLSSATSRVIYEWDPVLSDVIKDYSGTGGTQAESGFWTSQNFEITNPDEWNTARRVDWQILEHQWEPITAKGFRIYCDFHKSTKITEIELYGVAEDIGSNLAGSIVITFSDYGDIWWPTEAAQKTEELVEVYIGDSPRHIAIELIPVTVTRYDDIVLNVKTEDIYAGAKGCEYIYHADSAKTNVVNEGQLIEVKNTYNAPYDLYVDIAPGKLVPEGLIYYSSLKDNESIVNPSIGPDSIYYKLQDYPLRNQDYNCAINCDTFGLRNLIDNAPAYYSHNDMLGWREHGRLSDGSSINFYNLPGSSRTTVVLPELSRSRWWKFGLLDPELSINVREMRAYDNEGNLLDPEYFHDLNTTFIGAPVSERAPHLENDSVVGSYYQLTGNQYITMDLSEQVTLGRIELLHDGINDYVNFERTRDPYSGIDKYTRMCVRSWKDASGAYLDDVSYYQHNVTLHGTTYIDTALKNVWLHKDMGCLTDWVEWKKTTTTLPGYTSVFNSVTASGTVTGGTCEYQGFVDFDLYCSNRSIDKFWLDLREDSGTQAFKVWQHLPFEVTFKVNVSSYADGNYGSFCVGVLEDKQSGAYGATCRLEFWPGVQMVFEPSRNRFGLAVRKNQPQNNSNQVNLGTGNRSYTYTGGFNLNTDYYCKLTCYGMETHRDTDNVLYRAEIWTDAIDGSNRIVNLTRNTPLYWEAYRLALASCCSNAGVNITNDCTSDDPPKTPTRIQGRVTDLQLNIDADIKPYPWKDTEISETEKASIRIPAGNSNYVKIENSPELDVRWRYHTHDFWVKFNDLPAVGQRYTLMEQYNYEGSPTTTRGWRLALYNTGSWYRFEWWVNRGSSYSYQWSREEYNGQSSANHYIPHFNVVKDKWYFMAFGSGKQYSTGPYTQGPGGFFYFSFFDISGRAAYDAAAYNSPDDMYPMPPGSDIIIGKDFDGWICEPRISRANNEGGNDHGGHRYPSTGFLKADEPWQTPVKPYSRMYPFSFYISDNNDFFGHYADVDAKFLVTSDSYLPFLYYDSDNEFAEAYNTYFAIDFSHRYDLSLVRRYGAENDLYIDLSANVMYSNVDTDDPHEAFMTAPDFDPNDSFYGYEELINKDRWRLDGNQYGQEPKYCILRNGRLQMRADSEVSENGIYSNFGIRGDFDIQVTVGKVNAPNTYDWWAKFRVNFSDGDNGDQTYVLNRFEYRSANGSPYLANYRKFSDSGTGYDSHSHPGVNSMKLRIVREGYHFYTLYNAGSGWVEGDDRPILDARGKDAVTIHLGLGVTTNYPDTTIYFKDFKINYAGQIVMRSGSHDARWMTIEMLNGDDVSKYIKKVGIYPDITKFICPDNYNYNSLWTNIGPSITSYSTGENVALDTTVNGSSFIGEYNPANVTDGIIDNERSHAWLSDNSSEQWLLVDLGEEKSIYRVRLYHGYSTDDSGFIIEDYRIESSLDNQSFTTRWTITGNSSWTRTHDKADPFLARYIRLYITDYKANNIIYIKKIDGINYYQWEGACLREIEVYEYYGYDYINSEEWPIVAINLKDQFYIRGHSLEGLYTENDTMDWSNDDSDFAWSDSVHQDPQKVSFSSWGSTPNYEQWVVVKRDTATYHNVDPTPLPAPENQAYGVDYLKHVRIESETKENPIDYPWWWSSILSTLSRDFTYAVSQSVGSLKISYPASSALDTVQFIEGSNWGADSDMAFRDGLSFRWRIEDIDKLDTTEGYVFFGGLDGTDSAQPVEYRWYLSTLSGTTALQTGWNRPFFRFKDADEVIYNENADPFSSIRPTMPEYTQLQTFGFKFKGKGEAFNMNVDGTLIQRNHFQDSSKFDYGLYLAASDYLECPLSEIDLKSGTVEFWLRPDYTFGGLDIHRRLKNRSLFHLGNVANDVFGFMINSEGFNLYYGNLATDMSALLVKGIIAGAIDELYHIGVVFSANGKNLAGDSSTIKLYINNGLVATNYVTWDYTDEKLFKFTVGGKAPLSLIEHSGSLETTSIDGVMSNLRIYNYCKVDFTDSMNNTFTDASSDLLLPAKMIELSQNNLTYYKIGDMNLPFFYKKVPAGNTIQFYVRSIIPDDLTGKEDRTAGIVTSWDIGV